MLSSSIDIYCATKKKKIKLKSATIAKFHPYRRYKYNNLILKLQIFKKFHKYDRYINNKTLFWV